MSGSRAALVLTGFLTVLGCTHLAARDTVAPSQDPVIARLDQGITELNENLAHLHRHIVDLSNTPIPDDPLIEQLRALDLSAWRVHEQQWQRQVEHLKFTSDHIHQAQANPSAKLHLRDEWIHEQHDYTSSLQRLRDARYELERQRFLIESQLVQRYFE